ncbi:MerR family transcriptional regulator, redox-sensitive transcriptional activator SoxR [Frankia sp. AiPs1]
MLPTDLLTVGELSRRSGFAPSALRFYERQGLLSASRTSGGQRRYERHVLRRLAFIRAATAMGLSLDEVAAALASLPEARTPTAADWTAISRRWRSRLDEEIAALIALRDGLDACIGCGCLSLRRCRISNPNDRISALGSGARAFPAPLRRSGHGRHGGHRPPSPDDLSDSSLVRSPDSFSGGHVDEGHKDVIDEPCAYPADTPGDAPGDAPFGKRVIDKVDDVATMDGGEHGPCGPPFACGPA